MLKENNSLRTIITTYLLTGKEINEAEKDLIRLIVGNNEAQTFLSSQVNGNNKNNTFLGSPTDGSSGIHTFLGNQTGGSWKNNTFLGNYTDGTSGTHTFPGNKTDGRWKNNSANVTMTDGISNSRLAAIMENITPMMKTAPQKSIQNTAVILLQWQANPATTTPALCRLTGMSKDGMAKRIMVLKKAGIIGRHSHPLRYELTEKGQKLLAV